MNLKFYIFILTGVSIIGIIMLKMTGMEVGVLVPIATTLVGWLCGRNHGRIVGFFKKHY